MGTTSSGLVYPDPDDDVQIWQHIQNLADSVEPYVATPVCACYLSTDEEFVVSSGTDNEVLWTAEYVDTHDFHSTSSNKARITPNVPGYYSVYVNLIWHQDSDTEVGERRVSIRKNGSNTYPVGRVRIAPDDNYSPVTQTQRVLAMNGSSDYISVAAYQDTGNNKALWGGGSSFTSYIECVYQRPLVS